MSVQRLALNKSGFVTPGLRKLLLFSGLTVYLFGSSSSSKQGP